MKKLLFGFACLALIMSCEIPRSIVVKGTPELYVPLGSPFTEEENLAAYISADKIREMMDENTATTDSAHQLKIYEYQGTDDIDGITEGTLTYMVHYPIASMELDIGKYVKQAMNSDDIDVSYTIPDNVATLTTGFETLYPNGCYLTASGPRRNPGTPLFSIPLSDMSKLLKSVTGEFGLQTPYNADFKQSLELYIPAFKIGSSSTYAQGVQGENEYGEDMLQFISTDDTFVPSETMSNGKLDIYVKINAAAAGTIDIEEIFDWTEATIDTANAGDNLKGEYPIQNALGDFLGDDVTFKNVQGYIYVNGIKDSATLSLKTDGANLPGGSGTLQVRELPELRTDTNPFKGKLLPHSLSEDEPIKLDAILNNSQGITLSYQIDIPLMTIANTPGEIKNKIITADMIILLPLELTINTSVSGTGFEDYVKLDLGQDEFSMGSGDLFGRGNSGGSNNDDLFNSLEEVTILLKPLTGNNDISQSITAIDVDKLAILMRLQNGSNKLITFDQGYTPPSGMDHDSWGYLELTLNQNDGDFNYPFNPEFEILLKRDDGVGSSATFQIKQQEAGAEPQFDFNLAVQAKANINQTIVEF